MDHPEIHIADKLLLILWELGRSIPLSPADNPVLLKLEDIVGQLDSLLDNTGIQDDLKRVAPEAKLIISATALIKSGEIIETTNEWENLAKLNRLPVKGEKIEEFLTKHSSEIWQGALSAENTNTIAKIEFELKPDQFTTALCTVATFPDAGYVTIGHIDVWKNLLPKTKDEKQYVSSVVEYIETNLDEPLPSTNRLAKMFGTNEFSLKQEFRKQLNTSIYQYFIDRRLDKAYSLIQQTDMALKEIAFHIGYGDYTNFSKAFKRKFGYPPNQVLRTQN